MQSINPATGELIAEYTPHTAAELDEKLTASSDAFSQWRRTAITARAEFLVALGGRLRSRREELAALATAEMGKTITDARAEIDKSAGACDYFAENAARLLAAEPTPSNATESYVSYEPLGVVLAIMPWNYPFWQVIRAAVPALAAGNAIALKHASNVTGCALALEQAVSEAGGPSGLLSTVLVPGAQTDDVVADRRIAAVTLTGSSEVGAHVAAVAGQHLKRQVLELGGSDPFLVLADADIEQAAATAARARNQNNGQSCIAAKRFIVDDRVADEFVARFADHVAALRVGDPSDEATQVGPVARADLRDDLRRQVDGSVAAGAVAVTGGADVDGPGYFYAPTVLDGVVASMPAFGEETFGPVAAVVRVKDEDAAIAAANDSRFGLGATIWTADTGAARELARRIESGVVFVNGMVASDARLPFGGVKQSGYGRELGAHGIREFTNVQTVWIGPAR